MKILDKQLVSKLGRLLGFALLILPAMDACGIIYLNWSDSNHNTTAPAGALAGSGWQYEGQWGVYLGTAIAPNYFITAKHIDGNDATAATRIGQSFVFQNQSFTTTGFYSSPNSDLRIWSVSQNLPEFAPMYTGQDEVGKTLMVIGRGAVRGLEVQANSQLKGWQWGAQDNVQRWGQNQVASIVNNGAAFGDLLRSTFDQNGLAEEVHLAVGDSGGAVFIQDASQWKLAGINYAVDGLYNLTGANGQGFNAALYDQGGLYRGQDNNWTVIPDQTSDIPSAFYATRLSSNTDWILTVVPEPCEYGLAMAAGLLFFACLRRRWQTPNHPPVMLSALVLVSSTIGMQASAKPLSLHPENPHYFQFRGKPLVLITSGEHYGAVVNLDFNYVKYLDTLKRDQMNLTRLFTGAYVEPQGAFNITSNTLAPLRERFICPWARSKTPGYANGGNKFDLTQWNPAYFQRLKDFVVQAGKRDIIVEVNLFCPFYDEAQWNLSPQNYLNNINNLGAIARTNVYTLDKHAGLLAIHEAMTRKIVTELKDCDNVYYEICNEPYFGGVTMDWQHRIADVIVETEKKFRYQHLISQNIANGKAKVDKPHSAISIFNFHYATPPDTVSMNYGLLKVIGDNETGFRGTNNTPYRIEGWEFIMAGGGLYNNLDYSFVAGHEDGAFVYPLNQPGGGNSELRRQLRILKSFIQSFDFLKMKPNNYIFRGGIPPQAIARALVEQDKAYAIYIKGGRHANLQLELPAGNYRMEWINTRSGAVDKSDSLDHRGGTAVLASPDYFEDIALRIVAGKVLRKKQPK